MKEKILHIPSFEVFNNDLGLVLSFLERRGSPKWSISNLSVSDITDLDLTYFPNLVEIKNDLYLTRYDGSDLCNIERVGGNLDLFNADIYSLGKLKYVGGNLDLRLSTLTSLGNLEYVGGFLDLQYTDIIDLGKLKKVGKTIYGPPSGSLRSLGDLEYVGENLNINNSQIDSLGSLRYVGGDFELRSTPLGMIGEDEIRKKVNVKGEVILYRDRF